MRFPRIRENLDRLASDTQFWNQDFSIKSVDRMNVSLNDQDRAPNPRDPFASHLLVSRRVVPRGLGKNWEDIGGCKPFALLREFFVEDSRKHYTCWFLRHDYRYVGVGCNE